MFYLRNQGHYQITQEPMTWLARVGANGIAPRNNYVAELLMTPVVFLLQPIFVWYFDRVVKSGARAPPQPAVVPTTSAPKSNIK